MVLHYGGVIEFAAALYSVMAIPHGGNDHMAISWCVNGLTWFSHSLLVV